MPRCTALPVRALSSPSRLLPSTTECRRLGDAGSRNGAPSRIPLLQGGATSWTSTPSRACATPPVLARLVRLHRPSTMGAVHVVCRVVSTDYPPRSCPPPWPCMYTGGVPPPMHSSHVLPPSVPSRVSHPDAAVSVAAGSGEQRGAMAMESAGWMNRGAVERGSAMICLVV